MRVPSESHCRTSLGEAMPRPFNDKPERKSEDTFLPTKKPGSGDDPFLPTAKPP